MSDRNCDSDETPLPLAVSVTVRTKLICESFAACKATSADSAPAGMVTWLGTERVPLAELPRKTSRSTPSGLERPIVPTPAVPSVKLAGSVQIREGISLSFATVWLTTEARLWAAAVTETTIFPSSTESFSA